MSCDLCTDPDGVPCFPVYGLCPHHHEDGVTTLLAQVAPGFTPDPENPGCGTWWCPHCGSGKPVPEGASNA